MNGGSVGALVAQIVKQHGKGAIMTLGEDEAREEIQVISTGSLALDRAIGIGGYPRGRVVEVYGAESSGKTTLGLHAIREIQRSGGVAAYLDADHAFDVSYAKNVGVDTARLLVSQPDTGEQALEIADCIARSGAVDLIVIDSVGALVPKAEIDGEASPEAGVRARLMSQALRKMTAVAHRTGCTLLFLNQRRYKPGVTFENPEPGGNALKFYATVRLEVGRLGSVKVGEDVVGSRVRVKVVKNKCAVPFKEAELDILWGQGIDRLGDLLDAGLELGVVERRGDMFYLAGEPLARGRERAKEALSASKEASLRGAVEEALASGAKGKSEPT